MSILVILAEFLESVGEGLVSEKSLLLLRGVWGPGLRDLAMDVAD